jgi:hypothetical protein
MKPLKHTSKWVTEYNGSFRFAEHGQGRPRVSGVQMPNPHGGDTAEPDYGGYDQNFELSSQNRPIHKVSAYGGSASYPIGHNSYCYPALSDGYSTYPDLSLAGPGKRTPFAAQRARDDAARVRKEQHLTYASQDPRSQPGVVQSVSKQAFTGVGSKVAAPTSRVVVM